MRKVVTRGLGATLVTLTGVAYYYRPIYRYEPSLKIIGPSSTPSSPSISLRDDDEFIKTGLYSPKTDDEPFILKAARAAAITTVVAASRFFLEILNDTKIIGDKDAYEKFMKLVHDGKHRNRGMITVSNHTSVFDDPVLQSSITKFLWNPDHMRWGICKESICFHTTAASTFVGAGKVLPIKVGAGVEQKAFKALGRRLAEGEWVHIYPESACIQSGSLGRGQFYGCREVEKAREIGLLKWGVGKLAARTAFQSGALPPLIIPYYHVGMDLIKPQHNYVDHNSLVDPWYLPGRIGKRVRVVFGDPIDIQDLIDEYEKKLKRPRRIAYVNDNNEFTNWDGSTKDEFELYSKITKRVEDALVKLESDLKNGKYDLG